MYKFYVSLCRLYTYVTTLIVGLVLSPVHVVGVVTLKKHKEILRRKVRGRGRDRSLDERK